MSFHEGLVSVYACCSLSYPLASVLCTWYRSCGLKLMRASQVASCKESACQCRRCKRCGFDPWMGKIPWNRKWQPTPVFFFFFFSLQYSCLENPMDRGACRATVRGVARSWTQLSTHACTRSSMILTSFL